ncbi:PucR C-terminal helix-turn-helix domain-containing protein [Frankia sp. EI5c]|uniref:PucR family transcriptional regulator n=1 Tax=Frankia sp. EI5c TaxID=683316 RepID=UPI0007C2C217|nr:helix-turn-helix domain-containing protein [Frankia sp. EI5c]OAA27362.1 PucR C-terminal helix-turn-helix domain-containing protein [Frankia sp. EI5c]
MAPAEAGPPRSICDRLDRSLGVIAGRTVSAVLAELPPARIVPELGHGELSGLAFAGVELFARCLRAGRLPTPAELAPLQPSVALSAAEGVASEAMLRAHHIAARITLEEVARLAGPGEEDDVIAAAVFLQRFLPMLIPGVGTLATANAEHLAQRALLRELAAALLAGEPARSLADRAGVVLSPGYVVAVIRRREPGTTDSGTTDSGGIASGGIASGGIASGAGASGKADRFARRLHEAFGSCSEVAVPAVVDDDGRGATALFPLADGDTAAVMDRMPPLVEALTAALGGPVDVAAAVADTRPRLPGAHEQAAELLRLARALGRGPGLFRLPDLLLEYQLTRPSSALPALARLLDGLDNRPDLHRTLRIYLALDFRRQDAALHIHPNTLDYRLRRIAELTGVDPTTSHGLHLLAASLIVRLAGSSPA